MISDMSRRWREKYPHPITRAQRPAPCSRRPRGISLRFCLFSQYSHANQTNTPHLFFQHVIARFARIRRPPREMLAECLPNDRRGLLAQLQKQLVLFPGPRRLPVAGTQHIHPTVAALGRVAGHHPLRNRAPIVHPEKQENEEQAAVLQLAPAPLPPHLLESLVVARAALHPRPLRHHQRDLLPGLGSVLAHALDHLLVLLLRPHVLRDRGAEVVQPAFSALLLKNTPSTHLLSNSAVNVRRNCRPLLWTKFLHQRAENGVFLLTPGSLPFTHLLKHAPSPFGLEARSPIAPGTAPE